MTRLVRFPLADNTSILVEVDETEANGTRYWWRDDNIGSTVSDAQQTFEQALNLRSATESAVNKLRSLSQQPSEIEMEFGFNLSGEFGAFIAKVTAEANYKVTLRWTPHQENTDK